jgi:outer membrane lipoprotein-sorting protein
VNRARCWILLLAGCGLLAGSVVGARAQEATPGSVALLTVPVLLEQIEVKAKMLKTLSGRFRQTKSTRLLAAPMESEGVFYWQPPDRFRWEVTHPAPFTLVAQGDTLLVVTHDLRRAALHRHPSGAGLLGQIIGTAGDTEAFKRSYYLQITPATQAENRRWVQLQLEPRSARQAKYLKRVEVMIDPLNWLPQQITITEVNGDWSCIRLQDPSENVELPDELFSVQPPAGMQVQQLQGTRRP